MKALLLCLPLAGCAVLPDTLRMEAVHNSHLAQHLGSERTSYGRNAIEAGAVWRVKGITVTVEEGYNLYGVDGCLRCPREVFEARVGYDWRLK